MCVCLQGKFDSVGELQQQPIPHGLVPGTSSRKTSTAFGWNGMSTSTAAVSTAYGGGVRSALYDGDEQVKRKRVCVQGKRIFPLRIKSILMYVYM